MEDECEDCGCFCPECTCDESGGCGECDCNLVEIDFDDEDDED